MTELVIKTKYGRVEGFVKNGLSRWYGIPYAKPPVGNLRFRRAVECESWTDIKNCTEFASPCYQFKSFFPNGKKNSENCLTLNIWRQNNDKKNLPVMLYIHGGYLHNNSGNDKSFHGDNVANEGVLYISINYRLGPLGCYDFSIYNKEAFDSNCTLSDQIMALKWVNDNIQAFGGDPQNITIMGESAGGASVLALMTSPAAKGLFQKAICQSGYPDGEHFPNSNKLLVDMFLEYLKISPKEIELLRDMNIEKLVSANHYVFKNLSRYPGIYWPNFVYDDLLPEDCYYTLKNGSADGVKLILGTNKNESTFFALTREIPLSKAKIKTMFDNNNMSDQFPDVDEFYFKKHNRSNLNSCLDFGTDHMFLMGSIKFADIHSQRNDVWMYRFDYEPPLLKAVGVKATHGIDIFISLKTMDPLGRLIWTICKPSSKCLLEQYMFNSFVTFAKTGNPNGDHLNLQWEKYNTESRKTFLIDKEPSLVDNPNKEKIDFWKTLKTQQFYK